MSKRAQLPAVLIVPPDAGDIDRLGRLRARITEHETRIAQDVAEEDALSKKLLAHYGAAPADQIHTADGAYYLLKLGMCAEQKRPLTPAEKAKVLKWLGKDVFLALANITFELLKGALSAEQFKEVVTQSRTGRRSLEVVPKTVQAEAA